MAIKEAHSFTDAPKIYHITHLDNLPSLVADGCLWSDAESLRRGTLCTTIGMSEIKRRRLEVLKVTCHPGIKVGECVPFYFCPRSIMLYLLHRGNAPGLHYTGGQRPIVHLEADLKEVVAWADEAGQQWAFTTSNAGAYYADFYASLDDLHRVNWNAVYATDFTNPQVKEGKQAEFLLHHSFPWHLFRIIGVIDTTREKEVKQKLSRATHFPVIRVAPEWYY